MDLTTDGTKLPAIWHKPNPWESAFFGNDEESSGFAAQMFNQSASSTTADEIDRSGRTFTPIEPFAFSPSKPQTPKAGRNFSATTLSKAGDHSIAFEALQQTSLQHTGIPQINMTLKLYVLNTCLFLFLQIEIVHHEVDDNTAIQTRQQRTRNSQTELSTDSKSKKVKVELKKPPVLLSKGVTIEDVLIGKGIGAKKGKVMSLGFEMYDSTGKTHMYSGTLKDICLGDQTVLDGLNIGLVGMKVGGQRIINCPSNTAFGSKGLSNKVKPNTDLQFKIDLKSME